MGKGEQQLSTQLNSQGKDDLKKLSHSTFWGHFYHEVHTSVNNIYYVTDEANIIKAQLLQWKGDDI